MKKSFSLGDRSVVALSDVNLEIKSGEFVVVFGPSGSGKTTLLSLLSGLDQPSEGEVFIRGTNLYKQKENDIAYYRRTKIGVVFQQFNLVPTLSAVDNIAIPLLFSGVGRREAYKRSHELLLAVNLKDRANHKPQEMSGGEQQRVAIARALASNPWILFVDEPTGNLDVEAGEEVMEMLQKINRWGRTIVLVTHNPGYLKYGHRIVFVENGKISHQAINSANKISRQEPVKEKETGGSNDLKYYIANKGRGRLGILETLRLSFIHFASKRIRAFLTTLGVALGVGSIVTLVSLGIGLQKITANQIASFDTLVTISVAKDKTSLNDLDDTTIKKISNIPNVSLVSPSLNSTAKVTLGDSTSQVLAYGLKEEALSFEGVRISSGGKFADGEGAIISKAALKNFDNIDEKDIVGEAAKIQVMSLSGSGSADTPLGLQSANLSETISGVSSDETVAAIYLPLEKMAKLIGASKYSTVKVKVNSRQNVEGVRDEIEKLGFATTSVVDLIKQVDKVFFITQVVLGIIGGVALLVALIGIINIMTISLLERTHEVGVFKAIGATNGDVRRMFQYEVIFFGLFGGLIGVGGSWLLGYGINALINYLIQTNNLGTEMSLFVTPYVFALEMVLLTVVVSMMAGWYPARRASKLSPMEALRYE